MNNQASSVGLGWALLGVGSVRAGQMEGRPTATGKAAPSPVLRMPVCARGPVSPMSAHPKLSWAPPVTLMDELSQGTLPPSLGQCLTHHWGLLGGPAIAAA